MTEFLLATLYAPLSSWGDIAVGEVRSSWDYPSRSAIFGLVAAALGIPRSEQDAHDALDASLRLAVRLDLAGALMVDYHTTQSVAANLVRKGKPTTRATLLALGDRETMLSRRTLRQDALSTLALWAMPNVRWSLRQIADAIHRPGYVLFAGRKANALALPMSPQVVEANTLAEAFGLRDPVPAVLAKSLRAPAEGGGREVAHDACDGFDSGLRPLRRVVRRDSAAHRGRWQFAERTMEIGLLEPAASS